MPISEIYLPSNPASHIEPTNQPRSNQHMLLIRASKKNNGSILMLAMFIVPLVLALSVLTLYLGQVLLLRNQMQNAADASALAAAKILAASATDKAGAINEAIAIAKFNNFTITSTDVSFTPSSGDASYVTVNISASLNPLFNFQGTVSPLTQKRYAKARVGAILPCLINLSDAKTGQLTASGSSSLIDLQTCSVASNSGIKISGRLNTSAIYLNGPEIIQTVGGGQVCDSKNTDSTMCDSITPVNSITQFPEPSVLMNLPVPPPGAPYQKTGTYSNNDTTLLLTPGNYSNFKVTGTGNTIQFTPNSTTAYNFEGGFTINSGNKIEMKGGPQTWDQVTNSVATEGVFIYIPNGTLSINADTVQLISSTVGPYKGVIIKQALSDTNTATINVNSIGGIDSYLRGDLDFPNLKATLTLTGGSSSKSYLGVVAAGTIKVTGNSHLVLTNKYSAVSAVPKPTALVE